MGNLYENSITGFLGLQEPVNPIVVKSDTALSVYAHELNNLRPIDGALEGIKGTALHSTLGYKMADRPTTLIRFTTSTGAKKFLATAWDNILVYGSGGWEPLLDGLSDNGLIPSGLLYGAKGAGIKGNHKSYVNFPFDHCSYDGLLYLCDGMNLPMKTDGSQAGTWGFKQFTADTSPLSGVVQTSGLLPAASYFYYASLFDSTRNKWGEKGTIALTVTTTVDDRDIWIYVNGENWSSDDNYDMENQFADKVKIWRAVTEGGQTNHHRLAGTVLKGIVSQGTYDSLDLGAGVLTDISAHFVTDGVVAGYMAKVGGIICQITEKTDTTITLVNADGGEFSWDGAGSDYQIWGGFIDFLTNVAPERYHTELYPAEDHTAPPRFKYCVTFKDRAFGFGGYDLDGAYRPNRGYYSEIGYLDYWPLNNYQDIGSDDDEITGVVVLQGRLIVFKQRSVAIWNVLGSPVTWSVTERYLSIGAVDRRAITDCDGMLAWVNSQGVWLWGGDAPVNIVDRLEGSFVPMTWKTVRQEALSDARIVYHVNQKELIVSLPFANARNLFNPNIACKPDVSEEGLISIGGGTPMPYSQLVGLGGGLTPPQANGALVYRLAEKQWYFVPHMAATAWCVFRGKGDAGELYRGGYGAAVWIEDDSWGMRTQTSVEGQVSVTAPDHPTYELKADGATWTANEHVGKTIWVTHFSSGVRESATIISNTGDTAVIGIAVEGPFWEENPNNDDYYSITSLSAASDIELRWRTGVLSFSRFRDLKWLIEMMIKRIGSGDVTFTWSMDQGAGASGQMEWTLGDNGTRWDVNYWYDPDDHHLPDSTYLMWSDAEDATKEEDFPDIAEGRLVELMLTLKCSAAFTMTLISIGYKVHSGSSWRP